ncbi:MAG: DUF1804 family protein [Cetobacterium sp.]
MEADKTKDKARSMYESGYGTLKQISEKLKINLNTVKSWKKKDKDNGHDWVDKTSKKPKKVVSEPLEVESKIDIKINLIDEIAEKYRLSDQQVEFAIFFGNGNSVFSSCLKAGYSKSYSLARGYCLIENVGIKKIVEYIKKLRYEYLMYNEKDVLNQYIRIAQGDLGDYFNESGTEVKDFSEVDTGIIKEYQVTIKPDGSKEVKFKLESKHPALKALGEYFGMFKESENQGATVDGKPNPDTVKTILEKVKGVKK